MTSFHGPADYLAAARATPDPALQAVLAASPYSFVWEALALNPITEAAVLGSLAAKSSSTYRDNGLLRLLAVHPNASADVLQAVLVRVRSHLEAGYRPYGAAVALAGRSEVSVADIEGLAQMPSASMRLRIWLERALADREPACPPDTWQA